MLSIVIHKPSPDARLGLSLETDAGGRVTVSRVSPSGPFGRTALRAGMEIITVDDVVCHDLAQVSSALKDAAAGSVTVQVIDGDGGTDARDAEDPRSAPTLSSASPRPSSQPTRRASSYIDVESGAVEMQLNANSQQQQQQRPKQRPAQQRKKGGGGDRRTATTTNPTDSKPNARPSSSSNQNPEDANDNRHLTVVVPHQSKLGLRLQQTADRRHVAVKRVDADGVFGDTEVRTGMRIVAVNDYECVGLTVDEVSRLFHRSAGRDGLLTLMLERDDDAAAPSQTTPVPTEELQQRFQRYKSVKHTQEQQQQPPPPHNDSTKNNDNKKKTVRVSVMKDHPAQPTGIRLKETPDRRRVCVDVVRPGGLIATRTALRVGMVIRRVNGTDVRGLTVQRVARMIRETAGTLTIEAR